MQSKDNIFEGKDARDKLKAGIEKVAQCVKVTMGTGGSNALLEVMESPGHMATNDGYTIASSIRLADPVENMGRNILLEAISRANKSSGDGSSTTCLLTSSIIDEGIKRMGDLHPMSVKRSLEMLIPYVEKSIADMKRDITVDEVGKVAIVASEDVDIGNRIQEIYQQIGKTGIVHWDISKTAEDTYTIGKGITIEGAGYLSPYMCDIDEKTGVVYQHAKWRNPVVLVVKEKITTAAAFEMLFIELNAQGKKEVVIFCDDIEATVVPQLVQTRMVQGFKTMVVKMPILWKDWWFEDIARATGATIIDPNAGIALKNLNKSHAGTVENITVTKDDTFIDGIKDMSQYAADMDALGDDESKLRASRLNTKTARYFVGAHSESALAYRRLKVEDAIAAAWHALNGGIVAGGGVALRNIADKMPETIGGHILAAALAVPEEQIAKNAGMKAVSTFGDVDVGLDTRTGRHVNMFEAGIVDPATIVLNACKNAISVAAAVLTCNTITIIPRQEEVSQGNPNMLMR